MHLSNSYISYSLINDYMIYIYTHICINIYAYSYKSTK